jgi:kynurenine formamidase
MSSNITGTEYPTYDELTESRGHPAGTSWGLFGNDIGTLNFITESARVGAASEIRSGAIFSLNLPTTEPSPPILGRRPLQHKRVNLDGGGLDDYYDSFFTQASSQWDALCHVRHPVLGFYQGYDASDVTSVVQPVLGIDQWAARGIAGRFVLIDVAGFLSRQGRPLDASTSFSINVSLLEEVLKDQGSQIRSGDVLLINTGWITWYRSLGPTERQALASGDLFPAPGLDPQEETARWLWNHQVAAVAADCPALERMPFDITQEDGFLHLRLIPKLGFAVGELFDLEALAVDCSRDGQYQGFFCASPLNTLGGAGSPANAVAIK